MVRTWIESDLPSRTRKCLVSLGSEPRPVGEREAVLRSKDGYNRAMFLHRHGFDLFRGREESRRGIEAFAPVVRDAGLAVLEGGADGLAELRAGYPREVLAVRGCTPAPRDKAIHA